MEALTTEQDVWLRVLAKPVWLFPQPMRKVINSGRPVVDWHHQSGMVGRNGQWIPAIWSVTTLKADGTPKTIRGVGDTKV